MYLFVRKRPWTPPNLLSWDEPLGTPAPASEGVAELRSLDSSWDFAMRTVAMSEDKACPAFSAGNWGHFQPGPRQKLGSNARTKEVCKLTAVNPVGPQKVLEPEIGRWQDHLKFPPLLFSLRQIHPFVSVLPLPLLLQAAEQVEVVHIYTSAPEAQTHAAQSVICTPGQRYIL